MHMITTTFVLYLILCLYSSVCLVKKKKKEKKCESACLFVYIGAFFNMPCLICGNKTTTKAELMCILGKVIQKLYSINLKANYTLATATAFL